MGNLRIGYVPDSLPVGMPRMLRRFAAAAPGIHVTLRSGAAQRLLEDVRRRQLDIAVVCLPAPVTGLRVIGLGPEHTVAAVPEGHPCAGEAQIALDELADTRLVQLARPVNPAVYDAVLAACRAAGIAPALLEVAEPAVDQVLFSVACGAGVALLPASARSRFAAPGVRFIPLAPPGVVHEPVIVARPEPSTTTAAFLRVLRAPERPRELAALAA